MRVNGRPHVYISLIADAVVGDESGLISDVSMSLYSSASIENPMLTDVFYLSFIQERRNYKYIF
jgi:hypothetical protein